MTVSKHQIYARYYADRISIFGPGYLKRVSSMNRLTEIFCHDFESKTPLIWINFQWLIPIGSIRAKLRTVPLKGSG